MPFAYRVGASVARSIGSAGRDAPASAKLRYLTGAYRWLRRQPAPLSVGCIVTHRCNQHCSYCGIWSDVPNEMTTSQWKNVIGEFARAGALRFGFSGGEPLLRPDIGELVSAAKACGAGTSLNSNGTLVAERISELRGLDILTTSLDASGPDLHDRQRRAPGSFARTLQAIETALGARLTVYTLTVVTQENCREIPAIVRLADEVGFKAGFQPVSSCSISASGAALLAPDAGEFREMTSWLLRAKREGRNVLSSRAALTHMLRYPDTGGNARCAAAGKYFCYVDPAGEVFPGHFTYERGRHPNGLTVGFARAFQSCRDDRSECPGCFIVPYNEMNRLFEARLSSLWDRVREGLVR